MSIMETLAQQIPTLNGVNMVDNKFKDRAMVSQEDVDEVLHLNISETASLLQTTKNVGRQNIQKNRNNQVHTFTQGQSGLIHNSSSPATLAEIATSEEGATAQSQQPALTSPRFSAQSFESFATELLTEDSVSDLGDTDSVNQESSICCCNPLRWGLTSVISRLCSRAIEDNLAEFHCMPARPPVIFDTNK
jgi:hypothetical protein